MIVFSASKRRADRPPGRHATSPRQTLKIPPGNHNTVNTFNWPTGHPELVEGVTPFPRVSPFPCRPPPRSRSLLLRYSEGEGPGMREPSQRYVPSDPLVKGSFRQTRAQPWDISTDPRFCLDFAAASRPATMLLHVA